MRLDKSSQSLWDQSGKEFWMVSQRFKGNKVASVFMVGADLPRSLKAYMLKDARKRVRVIIGRTQRRYDKAQRRAVPNVSNHGGSV